MIGNHPGVDEGAMNSSFDGSITRGLWAALVETLSQCSAAGPGLVGPAGPDQPMSPVGMFDYDETTTGTACEPSDHHVVA